MTVVLTKSQIERKSRIGNDVCVIIFQDGPTPFSPGCIESKYNHVYFVVQQLSPKKYRLAVASKRGVKPFGPLLKDDGIYEIGQEFRNLLLTKSTYMIH